MAVLVAGTFDDPAAAREAVERIHAAGVPAADISLVARDADPAAEPGPPLRGGAPPMRAATAGGVTAGAVLGAIGGVLAGMVALTIPGLCPVLVLGPLAATLGGAAVGAAVGGLVGGLVNVGVPEEYATRYATHVESGQTLVAVRTDAGDRDEVEAIMRRAGADNLYAARTAS